jgi:N utilization substance protein B
VPEEPAANLPTDSGPAATDAVLRPRDVRRLAVQALYTLDAAAPQINPDAATGPAVPHSGAAARAALRRKAGGQEPGLRDRAAESDDPASGPRTPNPETAPDAEALLEALEEPFDDGDAEVPLAPKLPAVELALAAWARRHEADAQCTKLAPDWPSHRQPPIDRAILRLAWYELTTGRVDAALAINEAIELAKQFSDEKAPPFINGVLDRVAKRLPSAEAAGDHAARSSDGGGDPWLNDAVGR